MFQKLLKRYSEPNADIHLYLVEAKIFPAEFCDRNFVVIGDHDEGLEFKNLLFITTLLIHSDDPSQVINVFVPWWKKNIGGNIVLEKICSGSDALSKPMVRKTKKLDRGEWSMNTNFFAFQVGKNQDRLDAVRLIKESDLKLM